MGFRGLGVLGFWGLGLVNSGLQCLQYDLTTQFLGRIEKVSLSEDVGVEYITLRVQVPNYHIPGPLSNQREKV